MGAQSFILNIEATNAREAFNRLCADARYECGNDSYNGTISTCSMGRCKKTYTQSNLVKNRKDAMKLIDQLDNGSKWTADYIDIGIVRYDVITVKKTNTAYNAKYKQQFVVNKDCVIYGGKPYSEQSKYHYDTKPEADKKAAELTMKDYAEGVDGSYTVHKMMIKISGNDEVSSFKKEIKSYKTKPKLKPMPNRKIIEVHEYMFFGWASC